jgi:hypothetical protein
VGSSLTDGEATCSCVFQRLGAVATRLVKICLYLSRWATEFYKARLVTRSQGLRVTECDD